jgi:hypothetical protein
VAADGRHIGQVALHDGVWLAWPELVDNVYVNPVEFSSRADAARWLATVTP